MEKPRGMLTEGQLAWCRKFIKHRDIAIFADMEKQVRRSRADKGPVDLLKEKESAQDLQRASSGDAVSTARSPDLKLAAIGGEPVVGS